MGWNEKGKRGIHCGRTLRRNCEQRRSSDGVILKYKENSTVVPTSITKSLLEDRYGLTDGLDMGYIPNNPNDTGLEFSLGKRKRWLLRDLVQERMLDDCHEDFEEEENVDVCFQERHIFHDYKVSRADCVSIYCDRNGQIPSKHKYSYYSDVRQRSGKKPTEIGYEICKAPSPTSWPNYKEKQLPQNESYWDVRGRKSKSKCKGIKNKAKTFELIENDEELKLTNGLHSNSHESKVKVVTKHDFQFATKNMNTSNKQGILVNLEEFNGYSTMKAANKNPACGNTPVLQRYGKGSAIFVGNDHVLSKEPKGSEQIQPKSFTDVQHKVNISVSSKAIEPAELRSEWDDNYAEGTTSPRKFAINITSLLPGNKLKASSISHVVFEVQSETQEGRTLTEVGLVHASIGSESDLTIAGKDFVSFIQRTKDLNETFQIKDVIGDALQCIRVMKDISECSPDDLHTPKKHREKPIINLDLLNSVCNWGSEVFTLDEAQQQIKEKIEQEAKVPVIPETRSMVAIECEICYGTYEDNSLTSLLECGHSFCNECWAAYLKTQVSQTTVKCPGYGCDGNVDSITMMCLSPLQYERHINARVSKHLEVSPDWKWCPGNHCRKLVKAACATSSMTVVCTCATAWCFQCKMLSHWPASCAEAKKFHTKSGEVERTLALESQELISSVLVKNCPQCDYPIEKFHGCQFMHCVLCNVHFCWNCVNIATYGHMCEKKPSDDLNEVFLNFKNKRFQMEKYVAVVLRNVKARKLSVFFAKRRKVKKLEEALSSYHDMCSMQVLSGNNSRILRFMENVVDSEVVQTLKEAIDLEFQARIVVDGLAKKAATSKSQEGRTASRKLRQLSFITERIDSMLQEPDLVCNIERLACLKRFIKMDSDIIIALKNISQ